ncbi:MAG TPA: c-type cytochrome [Puia sp.]|nr:c-type cytochrome [Puia sp.]
MKKTLFVLAAVLCILFFSMSQYGCSEAVQPKIDSASAGPKVLSKSELLARGKYIVSAAACSDCHSPKIFTAQGPVEDSSKILSGHPAGMPMAPIDKKVLQPGGWYLLGPDITSFVGPWGISFGANLTPDTATGIGAWTEEVFVKTLRTGKHLGQDGGRHILPPMPWPSIAQYTDEDLKAIFTYLRALPPIVNKVPAPMSPADVAKLK